MYLQKTWIEAALLLFAGLSAVALVAYRVWSARVLWAGIALHAVAGVLLGDVPLFTISRRVCPYGATVDGMLYGAGIVLAGAYVAHARASGKTTGWRAALFATGLCWACFRLGLGIWVQ